MDKTYRINDIFYSLQGEGHHTGRAAVFIRFSGCNLRCPFCDTDFNSFRLMTADEIIDAISEWCDDNEVSVDFYEDWDDLIEGDEGIIWEE